MTKRKAARKLAKHKTKTLPVHVLGKLKPKHISTLATVPEPLVVAVVPKSTWEKFLDWIGV